MLLGRWLNPDCILNLTLVLNGPINDEIINPPDQSPLIFCRKKSSLEHPAACKLQVSNLLLFPLKSFIFSLRFGSVFRNAIPPKRDYSPPSYEDIFEKTISQEKLQSESTTRRSHAIPQFDPFPKFANSQAFPETDRNSESTTSNYFRSQLNAIQERNQQMLFGKEEPKISTTQRTTTTRTTEMSLQKRREEQYLKAQQKLLQLQR